MTTAACPGVARPPATSGTTGSADGDEEEVDDDGLCGVCFDARAQVPEGAPEWDRSVSRAVQSHPNGGQFDFFWPPARTPHGGASYVW